MSDKELLEYAAKAAGYIIESSRESGAYVYLKSATPNYDGEYPIFRWDPLEDDGDALRLAATLGMVIDARYGSRQRATVCVSYWIEPHQELVVNETSFSDFLSSARRAIVRAAAEIGKSMP